MAKGALVPLKTDKSRKLTVIGMEDYIELGLERENIDTKELLMYIKLSDDMYKNRKVVDSIRKYLPVRIYQCRGGRNPTIASKN